MAASPGIVLAATIDVTLSDGAITMSSHEAKPGIAKFHIRNASTAGFAHEFVIYRTDIGESDLSVAQGKAVADASGKVVASKTLAANQAVNLNVRLSADRYVIICNRTGHYQMGMHTSFVVKP